MCSAASPLLFIMTPSRIQPVLFLLTLLLACLVPSLHGDTSTAGDESILAALTSVDLVAYTDRITFLPMSDIVLAYRLVDPTVNIQSSQASVATNLAALQAGDIDFAMSATQRRPPTFASQQPTRYHSLTRTRWTVRVLFLPSQHC